MKVRGNHTSAARRARRAALGAQLPPVKLGTVKDVPRQNIVVGTPDAEVAS